MLRSLRGTQPRIYLPSGQRARRHFNSTPALKHDGRGYYFSSIANNLPTSAIHDAFQHIYDYTSLPMLFSIPLAAVLFRVPFSAYRLWTARGRRDQRRAEPELRLARAIVEKQAQLRSNTGTASRDRNAVHESWIEKEWEAKKAEIERRHPRLATHWTLRSGSNRDITTLISCVFVSMYTSSIASLSLSDPSLFDFGAADVMKPPLLVCFALLAISNTRYYNKHTLATLDPKISMDSLLRNVQEFWKWTLDEGRLLWVYVFPLFAAAAGMTFPTAVALSCASNSAYTWCERYAIDRWLKMPEAPKGFSARAAVQSTKNSKRKQGHSIH